MSPSVTSQSKIALARGTPSPFRRDKAHPSPVGLSVAAILNTSSPAQGFFPNLRNIPFLAGIYDPQSGRWQAHFWDSAHPSTGVLDLSPSLVFPSYLADDKESASPNTTPILRGALLPGSTIARLTPQIPEQLSYFFVAQTWEEDIPAATWTMLIRWCHQHGFGSHLAVVGIFGEFTRDCQCPQFLDSALGILSLVTEPTKPTEPTERAAQACYWRAYLPQGGPASLTYPLQDLSAEPHKLFTDPNTEPRILRLHRSLIAFVGARYRAAIRDTVPDPVLDPILDPSVDGDAAASNQIRVHIDKDQFILPSAITLILLCQAFPEGILLIHVNRPESEVIEYRNDKPWWPPQPWKHFLQNLGAHIVSSPPPVDEKPVAPPAHAVPIQSLAGPLSGIDLVALARHLNERAELIPAHWLK